MRSSKITCTFWRTDCRREGDEGNSCEEAKSCAACLARRAASREARKCPPLSIPQWGLPTTQKQTRRACPQCLHRLPAPGRLLKKRGEARNVTHPRGRRRRGKKAGLSSCAPVPADDSAATNQPCVVASSLARAARIPVSASGISVMAACRTSSGVSDEAYSRMTGQTTWRSKVPLGSRSSETARMVLTRTMERRRGKKGCHGHSEANAHGHNGSHA